MQSVLTPRFVFWSLFLCFAVFMFGQIWERLDPLRNHPVISAWWFDTNVSRLKSPNANTGLAAWIELNRLYGTRWWAYDRAVRHVRERFGHADDPTISFRLRRSGRHFTPTTASGASDCRTVAEALMAILHQEEFTRAPYGGSWRVWWEANRNCFPYHELNTSSSNARAPRGRK